MARDSPGHKYDPVHLPQKTFPGIRHLHDAIPSLDRMGRSREPKTRVPSPFDNHRLPPIRRENHSPVPWSCSLAGRYEDGSLLLSIDQAKNPSSPPCPHILIVSPSHVVANLWGALPGRLSFLLLMTSPCASLRFA